MIDGNCHRCGVETNALYTVEWPIEFIDQAIYVLHREVCLSCLDYFTNLTPESLPTKVTEFACFEDLWGSRSVDEG